MLIGSVCQKHKRIKVVKSKIVYLSRKSFFEVKYKPNKPLITRGLKNSQQKSISILVLLIRCLYGVQNCLHQYILKWIIILMLLVTSHKKISCMPQPSLRRRNLAEKYFLKDVIVQTILDTLTSSLIWCKYAQLAQGLQENWNCEKIATYTSVLCNDLH